MKLSDVAEIRPSPIHGVGLFATVDIPLGIILIYDYSDEINTGRMNDADMSYPSDFSFAAMLKAFINYNATDNCNVLKRTDSQPTREAGGYITKRYIPAGTELTKRYGITGWAKWLGADILHINPLGRYNHYGLVTLEQTLQSMTNLEEVLRVLGYEVKFDHVDKGTMSATFMESFQVVPISQKKG